LAISSLFFGEFFLKKNKKKKQISIYTLFFCLLLKVICQPQVLFWEEGRRGEFLQIFQPEKYDFDEYK